MKLHSFKIEGFRRHLETEVLFSDATFLIGENNVGKSSVLKAIDFFLNGTKKIPFDDFSRAVDQESNTEVVITDKIVLTAEFRNIPHEANDWQGFKGRLIPYDIDPQTKETGLSCVYRKTFYTDKDFTGEMKELKRELKTQYSSCKTLADFVEVGLDPSIVDEIFPDNNKSTKKIGIKDIINALKDNNISEVFDVNESEEDWFLNPGGIGNNVLSRLPKFLLIPAQDKVDELDGSNGALIKTLNSLFDDVRDSSEHFKKAQEHLILLAAELDPHDENSDFAIMLKGLNKVVSEVFPNTMFDAKANLSDAKDVLNPKFDIKLGSNISTKVHQQGTGVVRSAVFAMLRYRSMRENEKNRKENSTIRPLFIAFEEPEIYLHPKAAFQMRETIYELACEPLNQIVCTTHSPYMIDLSKKSSQILNSLQFYKEEIDYKEKKLEVESITVNPFNITKAFKSLQEDDQTYVKLLLKIDDSIAKVFFARKVLIVEGDTEDIVFKETIIRLIEDRRKDVTYNWEIVKARGKATIISLVKYLRAMGLQPCVVHDLDTGIEHAEKFNAPIQEAVGNAIQVFQLGNCIEDVLGYPAPSANKPFKAYEHIQKSWGQDWESVTEGWRTIVESIFFSSNVGQEAKDAALQEVTSVQEAAPTIE